MNTILKTFACLFMASSSIANAATILQVTEKTLVVDGKPSRVFSVTQPDGTFGYVGVKGQLFDVTVMNKTAVPLVLHWHGIIDPNQEDGVPYVTQLPIMPGKSYDYHFLLKQAGTFWLHSHYKLQEQKLMAAPLIIHDPAEKSEPEAVMFLQDFSFKDPKIIYAELRKKMQAMGSATTQQKPKKMSASAPDVNDVKFDAYLTNHHTLKQPDVIRVHPAQTMRLRIINASASSNYYIDLGKLRGDLIAIDGAAIQPVHGSQFQIGIGNRLDIRVKLPAGEGAYPILALPEGLHQQTGMILATPHALLPSLTETTDKQTPVLDYAQELRTVAADPMTDLPVAQAFNFSLGGDMQAYRWTINGQAWPDITATMVKAGKRTAFVFDNQSGMAHPMHFHGHVFQIVEINGKKINGRKGDTIDVMPYSTVKVIFDTDNSGIWMLHCHVLYHAQGGMMTTVNYVDYPDRFTKQQREAGDALNGSSSLLPSTMLGQ